MVRSWLNQTEFIVDHEGCHEGSVCRVKGMFYNFYHCYVFCLHRSKYVFKF